MQEMKYDELERRASHPELLDAERRDAIAAMEARSRVHGVIEEMKSEGTALVLTDEEEKMLRAFRRFKLRMRRHGEVFTWQSRMPEGVQIAEETAEIINLAEALACDR